MNFQTLPNKETWEYVYVDKDPNHMFNSFLCTFLNIFQASFSVKYNSMKIHLNIIRRWEDNLKMDLQEVGGGLRTGWSWLRIGTGGGHL